MRTSLVDAVRRRAGERCEYCRLPSPYARAPFQIDHVIAQQHSGLARLDNLALSCFHCNSHKGPNIAGLDPETLRLTPIYNPRVHIWSEHFRWKGFVLFGKTPIGRTTIYVLAINDPLLVAWRQALAREGVDVRR